ncbi:MAG TPA: hypothetical protein VFO65_03065 [Acidimicrobiales bacterium]|nr:hypothetical protein [Acidimicrobiales bacterium]
MRAPVSGEVRQLLVEVVRVLRAHRHRERALIPLDAAFAAGLVQSVLDTGDVRAALALARREYAGPSRDNEGDPVSPDQLHLELPLTRRWGP